MSDLSRLVSHDSRTVLQRWSRGRLKQACDRVGIAYPAHADSKDNLIKLLDGSGYTGLEPELELPVREVRQRDENGAEHVEVYPDVKPHFTERTAIDYDTEIGRRAAEAEPTEDELFEDTRLNELEKRNTELEERNVALTAIIDDRLSALENKQTAFPLDKLLPWQLNHMCKDAGIDPKGLSKADMIVALEDGSGENTSSGGQRDPHESGED